MRNGHPDESESPQRGSSSADVDSSVLAAFQFGFASAASSQRNATQRNATQRMQRADWTRRDDIAGGICAYFIATFVFYWWHRWRHELDVLWRLFHQIHHSPQRLEVITSFYKHPGEMVVNSVIGSLLVYSTLGLSMKAGAVYTFCTAIGEFFYHTNCKTPRWVGLVFQRPEMHRIHHESGSHKNNYGDITWWDMLFGTYENPATWDGQCGFEDAKEQRLSDMIVYRDVHRQ